MADSRLALVEAGMEFAPRGVPLLEHGFDVRTLAMTSGEATVDLVSRQIDSRQPEETHNEHRTVPRGFESIVMRLTRLRNKTFGRIATVGVLSLPALAACGGGNHNVVTNQAPGIVQPDAAPDGDGGQAAANRVVIGDAACYEGYATLSADRQAECDEAFDNFTMDQVTQLSPLDQARWAYTYHHKIADGEDGARLNWTRAMENNQDAADVADSWITGYSQDIMRLAWMMQSEDQKALANDPRTLAAFFGVGTTPDSLPVRDAKWLAESIPASGMDIAEYRQRVIGSVELLSSASGVQSAKEKDGGYTVTFTSHHHSGTSQGFTVRFFPYLNLDTENGKSVFRTLTDNDEASMLLGKPLIGMQVPQQNA